jgi:hypothetical protein
MGNAARPSAFLTLQYRPRQFLNKQRHATSPPTTALIVSSTKGLEVATAAIRRVSRELNRFNGAVDDAHASARWVKLGARCAEQQQAAICTLLYQQLIAQAKDRASVSLRLQLSVVEPGGSKVRPPTWREVVCAVARVPKADLYCGVRVNSRAVR